MDDVSYRRYAHVRIKGKPLIFKQHGQWLLLSFDDRDWWLSSLRNTHPRAAARLEGHHDPE